jgi:hypothetical protein
VGQCPGMSPEFGEFALDGEAELAVLVGIDFGTDAGQEVERIGVQVPTEELVLARELLQRSAGRR